jgi:hypothetical protein
MPDFNISIFPGAAGAVADASVLAEVSATPASAETVLARSLSALLEAGSAVKSAPLAWATCPFHQVMGGADPLPFPRPGTARRRPPPQSARHLPPEEKNMVIPPEAPPGSGVSRHADWQTSGRRTMVVIVTLLLAAAFVLAGANTSPQCRGEQPGVCPYSRLA